MVFGKTGFYLTLHILLGFSIPQGSEGICHPRFPCFNVDNISTEHLNYMFRYYLKTME